MGYECFLKYLVGFTFISLSKLKIVMATIVITIISQDENIN